jgi:hypothetical protein
MTRFTTKHLITIGSASALLLLTACGSDDDSSDNAEACDAWVAADSSIIGFLFTGEGDADSVNIALDAAIAAAPDDIVDTITELKATAQPQLEDPESEAPEETLQLYGDTIAWAGENCDVETLDVTAVDYGYDGIPDTLSTGYHVLEFTNEGQEQHEMFAFKINDGVAETLDEIFAMSEEEIVRQDHAGQRNVRVARQVMSARGTWRRRAGTQSSASFPSARSARPRATGLRTSSRAWCRSSR